MTGLIVIFVTAFVDMVGLAMVLPLLPYYANSFGAGATLVGVLVAAFSLAQLGAAPFWGRLSDRHGRPPAIIAALLITALGYVLFAMADSLALLLASRIVQGVGGGTIGVLQAYVADASAPEQRTTRLGWLSAVGSLAAVAGPAFGSACISLAGRPAPGYAAAGLAALMALLAWRHVKEPGVLATTAQHRAPVPTSARGALKMVLTRWRDPASRLIWIYTMAVGAFYGTVPVMPLLLVSRLGIDQRSVGYVIMYLGGVGVIARALLLGPVVRRLGEERASRLGIALLAVGLALFGATTTYTALVASLTLMPLGTAFLFPSLAGQLSRLLSRKTRGLYLSVQQTFGGAARVVFPLGTGVVMDRIGVGAPFFGVAALVLLSLQLSHSNARPATTPTPTPTGDPARATAAPSTG